MPATDDEACAAPRDPGRPVQVGEVETYLRCPRQYAYRHVYGLRGQESGLAALREGVRACIRELRARAARAASGAPRGDAEPGWPSLAEALVLLDHHWQAAAEGQGIARDALAEQALRRHGRRLIEREWRALAGEPHARGAPPEVELDYPVAVHAVGRDIQLALDRVERPAPAALAVSGGRPGGGSQPVAPVRFVRQHLGSSAARSDVRALLYALAAEQLTRDGQPAEAVQQSAAGVEERIALSRRQEERVREELARALQGMEDGSYPPRPDPHICASCPFLWICPA